mgnify:CR=1 FL=1|jgi:hypothetical protein
MEVSHRFVCNRLACDYVTECKYVVLNLLSDFIDTIGKSYGPLMKNIPMQTKILIIGPFALHWLYEPQKGIILSQTYYGYYNSISTFLQNIFYKAYTVVKNTFISCGNERFLPVKAIRTYYAITRFHKSGSSDIKKSNETQEVTKNDRKYKLGRSDYIG